MFRALAIAAAVAIAAPAAAVTTIDLSINTAAFTFASFDASGNSVGNNLASNGPDGVTNNDVAFFTATTTFNLPAGFTSAVLNISNLSSDDRVVAQLNGTTVGAAGIFGPGNGRFFFAPTGDAVDQVFADNGAQTIAAFAPFVTGVNTLTLIVNNNNNGIFGDGRTGGPSSVNLAGAVSFNAVPEPATWAMMIAGFGLVGVAARRRRTALAA